MAATCNDKEFWLEDEGFLNSTGNMLVCGLEKARISDKGKRNEVYNVIFSLLEK